MTIGKMTAQQLLRECEVFSALTTAQLEKISSSVLEKQYEAGTTIIQEGDSAEELLVIQEGKVAVQMTMPKEQKQMIRRVTIDIVTKNQVLGWSAFVEPHIYNFTAVCLQKVKALSLSGTKLRWLIQDNPKIGFDVMKELIKVIDSRLVETRHLLICERLFATRLE